MPLLIGEYDRIHNTHRTFSNLLFAPEWFQMEHRVIKSKMKCCWHFICYVCVLMRSCNVSALFGLCVCCACIFYSIFFPSENWMGHIQFDHTRTWSDTKMYEHFCWAIVSMKWLLSELPLLLLLLYHCWISWLGCQKGNYFSWPKGTNSTTQLQYAATMYCKWIYL